MMSFKPFLTPGEIKDLQLAEAQSDKKQKRTPEQIEAIYSNGTNILVSASAGSGKTFVMVERIMDKIMRGVTIDQLFISTFTVKAAGELKERLEAKISQAIKDMTDMERKRFLTEQLAGVQTADIGTMDAFTQKLVSQYGYTLGISPSFRILQDKNEQDLLKNEVFDDLFADYLSKQGQAFQDLVKNVAGKSKTSSPFKQLVYDIYSFSQSTSSPQEWLQQVFLKGHQEPFDQQASRFLAPLLQQTENLIEPSIIYFRQHVEAVRQDFGKDYAYLANVEELIACLTDLNLSADRASLTKKLKVIDDLSTAITMRVGRTKDERLKEFASTYNKERKDYITPFKDLARSLWQLDIIKDYQAQALPLLQLLQAFVLDFSDQYLQAKRQENAFEFSDISHFAIAILEQNPTILQLYRAKYHELMVDEYQDNNHTQERLLELLSNGYNRFMVGDIKQSIYRFRQADPQIFNQKFKAFRDNPTQGKLIILKENFRSQSEVLDSTNAVFSHLMDEKVGEILYDDSHQLKAGSPAQLEKHPENETELLLFNTDSTADIENDDQGQLSPSEVKLVAKEIIRLHREEKVPFEDITLLVASRTRNDGILQTFEQYGIPLVADGGEQHYLKSVEVMVMLDTLRTIDNPLNDYALVALLRSAMFQFDEDDLARIAVQADSKSNRYFYEKLELASKAQGQHPELVTSQLSQKLDLFLTTLAGWRAFAKTHSLYDLIWKIYQERFYYDYVGTLPKAQQRQANLYALALRANQFEQSGFKGLPRFIRMIDKVLDNDNDLADVEVALPKQAVTLMTIHKSKGLEFKYVFVLNLDKTFSLTDLNATAILSRQQGIGFKYLADVKERLGEDLLPALKVSMELLPYQLNQRELKLATLSEQMRLLYVAMTRAEKRLYLVGKASADSWSDKFSGKTEEHRLPAGERESYRSFQDWLLAIHQAFSPKTLSFKLTFVDESDLSDEDIGHIEPALPFDPDDQKDNRQSDQIKQALDMLEKVEVLNANYQAAIDLPSVRTPSQVKQFYQPIMDSDGVDVMDDYRPKARFDLPTWLAKEEVDAASIGSSVHELMQRLDLSQPVTAASVARALAGMSVSEAIKAKIDSSKIIAFFNETSLGQLIQSNLQCLHREAPFAMLKTDPSSGEQFVVRGIIDGYLELDDQIILFDYKTDKFKDSAMIGERYTAQMALYSEALQKSYQKPVRKYLILLGGRDLEVLELKWDWNR